MAPANNETGTQPGMLKSQPNTQSRKLALINRLIKDLRALLAAAGIEESPQLLCALTALLCFARLGISPHWLRASGGDRMLAAVRGSDLDFDKCELASSAPLLEQTLAEVLLEPTREEIAGGLRKIAKDQTICQLFEDPLCIGWVYQAIIKQSSAQERRDPDWHAERREGIAGGEIAKMTQWFTPSWIAEFLVAQSLPTSPATDSTPSAITFLDPACGAGHILVPGLRALTHRQIARGRKPDQAIQLVLGEQLFGLEIDPFLAALSTQAVYLASRRISLTAPLPATRIYSFRKVANGNLREEFGSLCLTVDDCDRHIKLDANGKLAALSDLPQCFSAIATNPPYLSHRLMPPETAAFLKQNYDCAQYDLYAAFLSLGGRLLALNGRMAMICQQSFLTIQRYQKLRLELLDKLALTSIVQLGAGAFAQKSGEKANNAIVVFAQKGGGDSNIECRQLLSNEAKDLAQRQGLDSLPARTITTEETRSLFASMANAPLSFFCPPEVADLFKRCPPLESDESGLKCTNGLFTCNNKRFVRQFFEINADERKDYVPYDKGGGHKWHRTTPYMVLWRDGGAEIRQYRKERGQSASLPGEEFYFQDGVTYSYIGTRGFKARLLNARSVFDIASSAIFSKKLDNLYVLGFLNSALVRFLLGVLNPTINFQIGDLRRLPFIVPDRQTAAKVVALAAQAVELAREIETYSPQSPCYQGAALLRQDEGEEDERYLAHLRLLESCNAKEADCQSEIDRLVFDLYGMSEEVRLKIQQDPWVRRGHEQFCKLPTLAQCRKELLGATNRHFGATVR